MVYITAGAGGWFNRTFMELKHEKNRLKSNQTARFNRTFMELKQVWTTLFRSRGRGFNRTFMELKQHTLQLSLYLLLVDYQYYTL